jgi:hypothetical protein
MASDTSEKPDGQATGKVADPEFRHQRAKRANEARNNTELLVQRIVAHAPELTTQQRLRLATMLVITPPNDQAARS